MSYRMFITNAPEAYDYDYTTSSPLPDGASRIPGSRLVCIPTPHYVYQTDRYMSGSYVALEVVEEAS